MTKTNGLLGSAAVADSEGSAPVAAVEMPAPLTPTELELGLSHIRQQVPGFARRIQPLYRLLGWRWGGGFGRPSFVPTETDILKTFDELLSDVRPWESQPHIARVETGGLFIQVERTEGSIAAECGFTDHAITFLPSDEAQDV